jgi:hypothetical protein
MKSFRLLVLGLLLAGTAFAADPAVSLVITYRVEPAKRVAFREWLSKQGAADFAKWKRDGVFRDCLLLFTSFAATSGFDAVVILDFARYTDSARWMELEKSRPGGLPATVLGYAAAESTFYADTLAQGGATRDRSKSVYLLAIYDVAAAADKYKTYVGEYIVPQVDGWISEKALSTYRLFFNHAPLSVVWDAILLLEYEDLAALARRDEVKAAVRVGLARTNPTWLAWSRDKSGIRTEKALVVAEAISLPE